MNFVVNSGDLSDGDWRDMSSGKAGIVLGLIGENAGKLTLVA